MTIRNIFWHIPRFFLFRLDAEKAHEIAIKRIKAVFRLGKLPLIAISGARSVKNRPVVFGMEFASKVGLAAGFDKNGDVLAALPYLGFGFAEIGTVTPLPQQGNYRPRLFRDVKRKSLFNKMGFNNIGAEAVAKQIASARTSLPKSFRVGINLGKNKDTPLELAAKDYAKAAEPFSGLADYLVINVSSPNTPDLRILQEPKHLKPIVEAVQAVIKRWSTVPPLLLKIAPEIQGDALVSLISEVEKWGINGWILTNTLEGEWPLGAENGSSGGWSGNLLTGDSRRSLACARVETKLPIISVGGIMSREEARKRVDVGADLIQLYSGWIFNGPSFPAELAAMLDTTIVRNESEAR